MLLVLLPSFARATRYTRKRPTDRPTDRQTTRLQYASWLRPPRHNEAPRCRCLGAAACVLACINRCIRLHVCMQAWKHETRSIHQWKHASRSMEGCKSVYHADLWMRAIKQANGSSRSMKRCKRSMQADEKYASCMQSGAHNEKERPTVIHFLGTNLCQNPQVESPYMAHRTIPYVHWPHLC